MRRVAEEAEAFGKVARDVIAQETLQQRIRKAPTRFRPRVGASVMAPPKIEYQTRTIVSEYAFATFKDSPALHEFRQVVSVDGQALLKAEKARQSLTLGVRSQDDNVKKRM